MHPIIIQSNLAITRVEGGRILRQKPRYSEVRVIARFPYGRVCHDKTSKCREVKQLQGDSERMSLF